MRFNVKFSSLLQNYNYSKIISNKVKKAITNRKIPLFRCGFYPLSANPTKWSNTLADKQTNCLSVFDHFVVLKGLIKIHKLN